MRRVTFISTTGAFGVPTWFRGITKIEYLGFGVYSFQLTEFWRLQKRFELGLPTKNYRLVLFHTIFFVGDPKKVLASWLFRLKLVQIGMERRNEFSYQKIWPLESKYFVEGVANIHCYLDVRAVRGLQGYKQDFEFTASSSKSLGGFRRVLRQGCQPKTAGVYLRKFYLWTYLKKYLGQEVVEYLSFFSQRVQVGNEWGSEFSHQKF